MTCSRPSRGAWCCSLGDKVPTQYLLFAEIRRRVQPTKAKLPNLGLGGRGEDWLLIIMMWQVVSRKSCSISSWGALKSCNPLPKAAKRGWANQLTRLPCFVVYVKFQFSYARGLHLHELEAYPPKCIFKLAVPTLLIPETLMHDGSLFLEECGP